MLSRKRHALNRAVGSGIQGHRAECSVICVHVDSAYASFRNSFARAYAETYLLPPPATVYGMLLALVGESFRRRHVGVKLAFAYARVPRVATTLRKLSRYKYGVASKQGRLGNAPDYVETLCGIEFLSFIDSTDERCYPPALETRVIEPIREPEHADSIRRPIHWFERRHGGFG